MPGMDWEEIEKRLKSEALAEEIEAQHARDRRLDAVFEEAAEEAFGGVSFKEYKQAVASNLPGVSDSDIDEAMKIIAEAKRLQDKGKTAAAASKLSHPTVRKVGKAVRKRKGCAIVALMMLGGSTATSIALVWGAVDLIGRMFG